MGKTIHERDAKVTAFKPAPLSPVACGIDTSCLQNSLKSRRGSAGVPARDIRIFACTIRSRRVCMYNIGALRKFQVSCLPISAYSSDVRCDIRHSEIRIVDSRSRFKIVEVRIRAVSHCTTRDWRGCTDDSTTFYMIIITSWNRVVPYSRLVFNRQDTGLYGKSLWRRGI
jgi:hypothetical protein